MKISRILGIVLIVLGLCFLFVVLGGVGTGLSSEFSMAPTMAMVDLLVCILVLLSGLYLLLKK